jgi:hypothetical protein
MNRKITLKEIKKLYPEKGIISVSGPYLRKDNNRLIVIATLVGSSKPIILPYPKKK